MIFLLLSLVLNNLKNYGRRNSKLFTNYPVSRGQTYYLPQKQVIITDLVRIGFNPGPGGVRTSSNIVCLV